MWKSSIVIYNIRTDDDRKVIHVIFSMNINKELGTKKFQNQVRNLFPKIINIYEHFNHGEQKLPKGTSETIDDCRIYEIAIKL